MSQRVINYDVWNRRWWKVPGESIWEDRIDKADWRVVFTRAGNDGLWNLDVFKDEELLKWAGWEHHSSELIFEESFGSKNVEHWISSVCMDRFLPPLSENVPLLNVISEQLGERLWVTGRVLRDKLKLSPKDFTEHATKVWPKYIVARKNDRGDEYTLTLPGLLLPGSNERFAAIILGTIAVLKALPAEIEEFHTTALLNHGIESEELPLADKVIRIASLGEEKSPGVWAIPSDIESIRNVVDIRELREYIRTNNGIARASDSVPLVCVGSGPGEDPEFPALHSQNFRDSVPASHMAVETSSICLVGKLKPGSFADIWKATDRFNRTVAVKFIRSSMIAESSAMEHASALARACHPNVVIVHSIEKITNPDGLQVEDGIVMEFIDGENLTERLQKTFSDQEIVQYSNGLIEGVAHIHASGLAHGDLHGDNVMVTPAGIKIIDILYRGTLELLTTTSRDNRIRSDLRYIADHIRSMLERSSNPNTSLEFVTALAGPIKSIEQLRKALEKTLSPASAKNTASALPDVEMLPTGRIDNARELIVLQVGADVGELDALNREYARVVWRPPTEARAFLRFSPVQSIPRMTQKDIQDRMSPTRHGLPYIGYSSGFNRSFSPMGGTQFTPYPDDSQPFAQEVSVLGLDGQVLLLDSSFLVKKPKSCWDPRLQKERFESQLKQSLEFYRESFDAPELWVVAGLVGLSHSFLAVNHSLLGPAFVDEIGYRWHVTDYSACDGIMDEFFRVVWAEYGQEPND